LCSWARHLTLTLPLSTQGWIPGNLMLGVTLQWTSIPSGGGGGKKFPILDGRGVGFGSEWANVQTKSFRVFQAIDQI